MNEQIQLEQRFVFGHVKAVFARYVDVELDAPLHSIRMVRVMRNHWPDGKQDWSVGERIERLFIYDMSSEAREGNAGGHWFGSILWGQARNNPWDRSHPQHPLPGQVLDGEVVRLFGTRAVLRLEHAQLEGFLDLTAVPSGRTRGVAEIFPLGLMVRAKVIEVDRLRCRIVLSVLEWLAEVERAQGHGPHPIGSAFSLTPYLRFSTAQSLAPPIVERVPSEPVNSLWHGHGVLLMDDDKGFSTNLAAWLQEFGAQAWTADNASYAGDLFAKYGDQITHVLMDYSLGSRQVRAEMLALLKRHRKGRVVAIMSGIPEAEAPLMAERMGFGFLPKPIRFKTAHDWLMRGELPKLDLQMLEPAQYWDNMAGLGSQGMAERGAKWLAAVCRQVHGVGALWVRCYRPGYRLVATYGLPAQASAAVYEELLWRLNQTLVADVEQDGAQHKMDHHDVGPLRLIWPPGAKHVWGGPLRESSTAIRVVDDVLLLFSPVRLEIAPDGELPWDSLHDWWLDLLALERAQDRLAEDASFATQGRVHMATLHELRPLMQAFESPRPWSAETALAWWPQGQKVKQLVNSGLYNIRPERIAQVNLHDRLLTLMDTFVWQLISRREVTVVVYLPPPKLTVFLPPEVFEQPLINLVDNATKFCGRRRWARVEVMVYVDNSDPLHPLVIRVSDQGVGMTPDEVRHLFVPRHTASGERGFGMGLYVSATLAKAAGGALELVSCRRWAGSVFELRLPLAWGQQSQAPRP
jgi:hypothetical protein